MVAVNGAFLMRVMRIIAGKFKGRRLNTPKGREIRPTSDRIKENIFDILGNVPVDARVIDLFAGTGGLGIEALSRGAEQVTFVDYSNKALGII